MTKPIRRKRLTSPKVFEAAADAMGFSYGIQDGRFVWTTSQAARNAAGEMVGIGDPERQAVQAFENVSAILEAAGGSLADVVKLTMYVTDASYCDIVKRVRRRFFADIGYPATGVYVVGGFGNPDYLVEVDAVAVLAHREK